MPISPCPSPVPFCRGVPSSTTLDREVGVAVLQGDPGASRRRVLDDVGQRLLHDPVRRQVDARRQLAGAADGLDLDRDPGLAHVAEQVVEPGEGRLRRVLVDLVLGVAEHREQPAHVAERRGVGALDRVQRLADRGRVGVEGAPGAAGLEHGHRDRVRDDVVELAGDAGPLLGDGASGELLLLGLQPGVLGVQHALALAAQPDGQPGGPRGADEAEQVGDVTQVGVREPLAPRRRRTSPSRRAGRPRPATSPRPRACRPRE